jgi:cytochrome c
MKAMIASVVASSLMIAGSVMAADMPDLAKKYGCSNCHSIDQRAVGPKWQDVANKYKGDPGASAHLATKIVKGGSGVWGVIPMPDNPKISESEVNELVTFILGLAK